METKVIIIGGSIAAIWTIVALIHNDFYTAIFMGAITTVVIIGFIPTLLRKFIERK